MKNITLIILLLFAIFSAGIHCMNYVERPTSTFETFEQMKKSGLIEKGWLPKYLPKSSTKIKETHNLDTNEVYASFNYKVGDNSEVKKECKLLVESKLGQKFICPPYKDRTTTIILRSSGEGVLHSSWGGI